jgi:hypothetical protein
MNPVFAPLNIVRPFDAAQHAGRSGAAGRDRIRTNYLTALVARHPDVAERQWRIRSLGARLQAIAVVMIEAVRPLALSLPRTTEPLVRGRVKFRVGRIVYVAFSRDETVIGFAFPREEREWLVGTEPEKFLMPTQSDLRYNWVLVRLVTDRRGRDARPCLRRVADGRPQALGRGSGVRATRVVPFRFTRARARCAAAGRLLDPMA